MKERMLLKDLLTDTKDGDWGIESAADGYTAHFVIRGADFADSRRLSVEGVPLRYLPTHTVNRRTLQPNDILIETAGGTRDRPTGRTLLITEELLGKFNKPVIGASFTRFLRANPNLVDPRYLFWYLQAIYAADETYEFQVQHTGIARFQYTTFAKSKHIPLPSVLLQQGIAEVLGALDDKIAANDHRSKISLELADLEFLRAAGGVHREGQTFGDVADIAGGGTPKTSVDEYWNGNVPWATPTDVTNLGAPYLTATGRTITEAGLASCSSRLYPSGSILMTSRATIGAFAIAQVPVAVNQGFIVVNAKQPDHQWWLFHDMRSRVAEFISHANGATFLELSRGKFKQFPVRIPKAEVAQSFADTVGPLHELGAHLMAETKTLAATRDELLPLLMSGKIRVRDAERVVEEVV